MTLIFGKQVEEVKIGHCLFWWLQNGASKQKLYTWIVSD
jgi:hypothetical protein